MSWVMMDEFDERVRVAKCRTTSREVLAALACDDDTYVREEVARNPNTPPETLLQLAQPHQTWYTRWCVAKNPSACVEALTLLSYDDIEDIRCMVARRNDVPVDLLRRFAEDDHFFVRMDVVHNSITPMEILADLTHDEDEPIRRWAWRSLERRGILGLLGDGD